MPKFFVVSDIHGFYDELIDGLKDAGFDTTNEEHYLIGCGDYFDRGPKPREVMRYLYSLPRKFLVRGNHEQLFEDCCYRGIPFMYDVSNGTTDTIAAIGENDFYEDFPELCDIALKRTKRFRESMLPYFETKNYIFVHSWIPVYKGHYSSILTYNYNPNWRESSVELWEIAMWGNPYQMIALDLLPDKTIVFGHWHCSAGWAIAENRSEFGEDAKFEPFYGDGYISIDGCTAHTKKINVVVLEDDFLE